ncbi:MAG: hypothetical protein ACF8SC_08405 [Phycisphaerales bacterium JB037]
MGTKRVIRGRTPVLAAGMTLGLVGGGLVGGGLTGCVGYTTYDPYRDTKLEVASPEQAAVLAVMTEGVRWTIARFPPGTPKVAASVGDLATRPPTGPVTVGLPPGLSRVQYLNVIERIGPPAEPLVGAEARHPLYVVGRIELRGGKAKVDVHRPLPEGGSQCLRLTMEGGVTSDWRVLKYEPYEPGVVPLPLPAAVEPAADSPGNADGSGA